MLQAVQLTTNNIPTTNPTNCVLLVTIVVVQLLSCVQLFVTPGTAARQASLSFTISLSLLKLMSIESVIPSNHLILCHPLLLFLQSFPASGSFPMGQFLGSSDQSIRASASVLPMDIQGWFTLGLTSLISLLSKWLYVVINEWRSWTILIDIKFCFSGDGL